MKILSPAGNFESLKCAVFAGANEVYLGINSFNARNNVDGFTIDTLKSAVDFAHLYGVKVCLALNILFSNEELAFAVEIAVKAYNFGVDSIIVQDLGLAKILSEEYPQITLHASTQMGIHNLEGVKAIEKYNFKRIVLARETPLEEIKRIKDNINVELEYFAHGALCVSFSGNCYMSSYLHSASGNRGVCKQLCRLPYTLQKDGKSIKSGYLLSAKDFDMASRLKDLKEAGVSVLKIEGRARRPFYVWAVTKAYKAALAGQKIDKDQIKLAFNRGFIDGYFSGNGNIISNVQNHVGIEIGVVEKVEFGKRFNQVYIKTDRAINPKSTFKLFKNGKEKCVVTAYDLKRTNSGYVFTTTTKIERGLTVNLIVDEELEKSVLTQNQKILVSLELNVLDGQKLYAVCKINNNTLEFFGDVIDQAKTYPTTKEEIIKNFEKSERFSAEISFSNFSERCFIPKQKLNEFRRKVFGEIEKHITEIENNPISLKPLPQVDAKIKRFCGFEYTANASGIYDSENVIYSPEIYTESNVKAFIDNCVSQGKTPYLDTPNFALKEDVELIKNIIKNTGIKIVANNYYATTLTKDFVVGAGLNVYNNFTAQAFDKPFFVAEGDMGEKHDFAYMTLRHCPLKNHGICDCKNCKYSDGYQLKSDSGKVFIIKRKKLSSCTFYLV